MSFSSLRLPTDIPWERICVSEDMLDPKICDKKFPPKWHTSIAVFKYKPEQDYQQYPNHEVIYLKVAVTITGYQPRNSEIEGQIDWGNLTVQTIEEVEDLLNEYHPCTGAIVQVAVAPHGTDVDEVTDYPYFLDFEPKKRELYEMATDTKEKMSRSLESLNIGKSSSTTQSQEVLDVDMGGSWQLGAQGSYAGTGGGFNVGSSTQGQWGTKQVGGNESGLTRTSDQATERRETASFTTQITQLYHQLDSYHLGTNRAIFFVQPRPHTIEEPSGFVRGPRPVEGIQEFFLLVAKPKEQDDICVSVRIDTAHLAEIPIMDYAYKKDELSLSVSAPPPERNDPQAAVDGYDYMGVSYGWFGDGERRYKCYRKRVEQVENYSSPWSDYKIDVGDNGGFVVTSQSADHGSRSVDVSPDGEFLTAKVWATARKCWDDGGDFCADCPDTWHARSANSSLSMVVNLISREAIRQVGTETVLLVTTRGLCCCERDTRWVRPGILKALDLSRLIQRKGAQYGLDAAAVARLQHSHKDAATHGAAMLKAAPAAGGCGLCASSESGERRMTARQANALSELIRHELTATVAPGRPETAEPAPYLMHDFFLRKLEARLRPLGKMRKVGDGPMQTLRALRDRHEAIAQYFGKPAQEVTSKDVARIATDELARITGLGRAEAAQLRLAALGIPLKRGEQKR